MFKILLRKNMREVGATFFRDSKKGGTLKGGKKLGILILYILVFLALAFAFSGVAVALFTATSQGSEWIAWSLIGALAVVVSTFINSLTSFTQLYLARDNELLLSMPIKPGLIVFSRSVSVYLMGLLYIAVAWVPAIVVAFIMKKMTMLLLINNILIMIIMAFMVLAFTCFFSWIIAYISTKLKSKKILVAIISLILIFGLYYLQFRSNYLISNLAKHIDKAEEILKSGLYPFYQQGLASTGNILGLLIFTLITAGLLALAYLLLSKTFIKIATTKKSGKTAKFSQKQIKSSNVKKALSRRERQRFTGSLAYLLNSGLGAIFMIIIFVFLLFKRDFIAERFSPIMKIFPMVGLAVPAVIVLIMFIMESLATTAAASISIEGKQIWILQTMPINTYSIFSSKIEFSACIQGIPGMLMTMAMADAFNLGVVNKLLLIILAIIFAYFSATVGLALNLKHPRLDWTSESVAVKQGPSIVVTLFGGWGLGIVLAVIMFLLGNIIDMKIILGGIIVILLAAKLMIDKWLKNTGTVIFQNL